MKAIILGSTGMIGKAVLLECLDQDAVEKILLINRQTVNIRHPKLKELIQQNFFEISNLTDQVRELILVFSAWASRP